MTEIEEETNIESPQPGEIVPGSIFWVHFILVVLTLSGALYMRFYKLFHFDPWYAYPWANLLWIPLSIAFILFRKGFRWEFYQFRPIRQGQVLLAFLIFGTLLLAFFRWKEAELFLIIQGLICTTHFPVPYPHKEP